MDRRSWPWKKKSSDKSEKKAVEAALAGAAAESGAGEAAPSGSQGDKDNYKKPNYVQISVESYTHLTGLEDQLKASDEQIQTLEDEINELNEKLSAAHDEISSKESMVKQHSKVAEEAVTGWEKAEAEALALKNHLETVTLSKLTAEDRAEHLDGALKECMRQIRNLKEDHERKLQDVVLTKTKQFDKMKLDLESKIFNLDQELLRSAAENAAVSRSLQERSNMLIRINDEKSQAEADIEHLKANIESCEKEISSLKYELHLISKELDIRNEEKNMAMRSSEAANRQHMEGVKKIAKLEAECQRLRGLVRKKLPGPAALAQMKLEVDNLGREYGDSRVRRSPSKPPSPHFSSVPEFSLDGVQKFQRETEFLTERIVAMEEETKMLKEALAKRNTELQASRNLCAKTASRLQYMEAQLHHNSQQRSSPKSVVHVAIEDFPGQNGSTPPSITSLSEDGNDDNRSSDSWATTMISELSLLKKDKNNDKLNQSENVKHLEIMDDFLEMEKLACLNGTDGQLLLGSPDNKATGVVNCSISESSSAKDSPCEGQQHVEPSIKPASPEVDKSILDSGSESDHPFVVKLRSRISLLLESVSGDADVVKILEDVKLVLQDSHDTLHPGTGTVSEAANICNKACSGKKCANDDSLKGAREVSSSEDAKLETETVHELGHKLIEAIGKIHEFVLSIGKEATGIHDTSCDGNGLNQKIEEFSAIFRNVLSNNMSLIDFVFGLSLVLAKAGQLKFNVLGYKGAEAEISSPDCIDKVALPENKAIQKDSPGERYENGHAQTSSPTSNPEVPDDGNLVSGYGPSHVSCKISLEEFEELKSEKENIARDLARYSENLEMTKSQLHETEQLLAEVRSQLASAQKSNSLSETQLKCMAESYRSLEARSEELETEVNFLRSKAETCENELENERKNHQDALTRFKELEGQLQMIKKSADDDDLKTKQDRDLTAAAEKLAECQETMFLLGKQLKSLRPQNEFLGSPFTERSQKGEESAEDEPTPSGMHMTYSNPETDTAASTQVAGAESPVNSYNQPRSSEADASPLMSPINPKHAKHRPTKSGSSSSSTPTPEKHGRGFTRFFSTKGKNGY